MTCKYKVFIILILIMGLELNGSFAINPINIHEEQPKMDSETRWDIISAGTGMAGLIMIFIPYISIFGLLLCFASLVLGIKARKKRQRKLWIRLGFFSGGLGLLLFLGVLGLILFF